MRPNPSLHLGSTRRDKPPSDINQPAATSCEVHSLKTYPYGARSSVIGAHLGQSFERGSCSLRCSQSIVAEVTLSDVLEQARLAEGSLFLPISLVGRRRSSRRLVE